MSSDMDMQSRIGAVTGDVPHSGDAVRRVPPMFGQGRARCVRAGALEQKPALAEQHRHELDLENVEQPGLQALLGCEGAVQHDISIACGRLCLLYARRDALGHELHPLIAIVRRSGVGRDEDRHAVNINSSNTIWL